MEYEMCDVCGKEIKEPDCLHDTKRGFICKECYVNLVSAEIDHEQDRGEQ